MATELVVFLESTDRLSIGSLPEGRHAVEKTPHAVVRYTFRSPKGNIYREPKRTVLLRNQPHAGPGICRPAPVPHAKMFIEGARPGADNSPSPFLKPAVTDQEPRWFGNTPSGITPNSIARIVRLAFPNGHDSRFQTRPESVVSWLKGHGGKPKALAPLSRGSAAIAGARPYRRRLRSASPLPSRGHALPSQAGVPLEIR